MTIAARLTAAFGLALCLSVAAGRPDAPSELLEPAGAEVIATDAQAFKDHVYTLANPFFEGRAPGTRGNMLAADYLEFYHRRLGLKPAFATTVEGAAPVEWSTYRQPFRSGVTLSVPRERLTWRAGGAPETALRPTIDFNTLAFGSTAAATGPLAFAGYSIKEGKDGYTSYPEGTDLSGKVVMLMRFEPMNDKGVSLWADGTKWSPFAGLEPKIRSAAEHHAAAVILVNPPGADDARVGTLEDIQSVRPNGDALDVPVVMMSIDAADALVRAADANRRSLADLRAVADAKGEIIDFPGSAVTIDTEVARTPVMTDNVGAILPGKGDLADEFVVIGAHYDHVGYGKSGSMDPDGRGKIHPGADDNASGTSGLLVVAAKLKARYDALPADASARSVLFLHFSAEEIGLIGSRHYTNNLIAPKEAHYLMINMDMIGRMGDQPIEVSGLGTADGLADFAGEFLDSSGLAIARKQSGYGPSDHASFTAAGVPVLFFFTGLHDQYHRPTDVPSLINCEGAAKVIDLVDRVGFAAATRTETLTFSASAPSSPGTGSRGSGVRLGIMPGDYSGDVKGVLVGEVFAGTPAEKAGIKKDDIITKWNGEPVENVEAWMPLMSKHKPGDEVTLTYLRDGQVYETKAVLVGRERRNQ